MSRPSKPVQTPGGAPADEQTKATAVAEQPVAQQPLPETPKTETDASANKSGEPGIDQDKILEAMAKMQAQMAALAAENEKLRADAASVRAPADAGGDAGSYRHLHSSQVDPKTLDAPVLCRDGWVVPTPKTDNTRI